MPQSQLVHCFGPPSLCGTTATLRSNHYANCLRNKCLLLLNPPNACQTIFSNTAWCKLGPQMKRDLDNGFAYLRTPPRTKYLLRTIRDDKNPVPWLPLPLFLPAYYLPIDARAAGEKALSHATRSVTSSTSMYEWHFANRISTSNTMAMETSLCTRANPIQKTNARVLRTRSNRPSPTWSTFVCTYLRSTYYDYAWVVHWRRPPLINKTFAVAIYIVLTTLGLDIYFATNMIPRRMVTEYFKASM